MTPLAPALTTDPGLPGVRGLFGEEGRAAVARFLEGRGWTVEEARPVQASYRPGRSCLVRFRARASGPPGRRVFSICAETRHRPPRMHPPDQETADRFDLAEPVEVVDPYLVWAFPYDPTLPRLGDAAWGAAVRERLGRTADRPAAVSVQPLRYRPRRRAVFRYRALDRRHRWRTIFGKVLPEKKATQSVETLNRVGGPRRPHLVVPFAMEDGVSFSNPAPGRSLRDLLLAGDALPAPARVAGLVNDIGNIPGIPSAGDHRMRPERIARATAELLGRLVPESLSRIALIEEAVGRGARSDQVPARVVHGDLYEAQVFVGADYSLGLIDLDDLGPGDPAMDAANFCAHLLALALAVPSASSRLVAYRHLVRREFMATLGIGPAELRWREALAVLLLATGPFRVLDPRWPEQVRRRIELAVRLMEEPRWSTSS